MTYYQVSEEERNDGNEILIKSYLKYREALYEYKNRKPQPISRSVKLHKITLKYEHCELTYYDKGLLKERAV